MCSASIPAPAARRSRARSRGSAARCHPDHAIDEEDRLLRERRLKQINVAWEITCRETPRALALGQAAVGVVGRL